MIKVRSWSTSLGVALQRGRDRLPRDKVQGFIQDFELGGKQDGSRMIVACVPTRGVWGHAPPPPEKS